MYNFYKFLPFATLQSTRFRPLFLGNNHVFTVRSPFQRSQSAPTLITYRTTGIELTDSGGHARGLQSQHRAARRTTRWHASRRGRRGHGHAG